MYVTEARNTVADKAVEVALNYVRRSSHLGVHVDSFVQVRAAGQDPKPFLNSSEYDTDLNQC